MGTYYKPYEMSVVETFDGTDVEAAALNAAYPDEITIQSGETLVGGVAESLEQTLSVQGTLPATATETTFTITSAASAADTVFIQDQLQENIGSNVSILLGDTAEQIAAKLRASTITGFTLSGEGTEVIVTDDVVGSSEGIYSVFNIEFTDVDVFTETNETVTGTDEDGARKELVVYLFEGSVISSGNVRAYLNSTDYINISVLETDTVGEAIDKLVAGVVAGGVYDAENWQDQVLAVWNKTAQSLVSPISFTFTPITNTSEIDRIEGLDAQSGGSYTWGEMVCMSGSTGEGIVGILIDGTLYPSTTIPTLSNAETIGAAFRAITVPGWTWSGANSVARITCDTVGSKYRPIFYRSNGLQRFRRYYNGKNEDGSKNTSVLLAVDLTGRSAGGDVAVYYNSATPTYTTTVGDETAQQLADLLEADVPEGYTALNTSDNVTYMYTLPIMKDVAGAVAIPFSASAGDTGMTYFSSVADIAGKDEGVGGEIVAGTVNVYYNSATATETVLAGGETLEEAIDLIVADAPTGYTATKISATEVLFAKDEVGVNVIPLSTDYAGTGVIVDSFDFTAGEDRVKQEDAVLSVITPEGKYINAYKNTAILFSTRLVGHIPTYTTEVQSNANLGHYWIEIEE